jgi:hypothetical protein
MSELFRIIFGINYCTAQIRPNYHNLTDVQHVDKHRRYRRF